jgi:hypothetical protein
LPSFYVLLVPVPFTRLRHLFTSTTGADVPDGEISRISFPSAAENKNLQLLGNFHDSLWHPHSFWTPKQQIPRSLDLIIPPGAGTLKAVYQMMGCYQRIPCWGQDCEVFHNAPCPLPSTGPSPIPWRNDIPPSGEFTPSTPRIRVTATACTSSRTKTTWPPSIAIVWNVVAECLGLRVMIRGRFDTPSW